MAIDITQGLSSDTYPAAMTAIPLRTVVPLTMFCWFRVAGSYPSSPRVLFEVASSSAIYALEIEGSGGSKKVLAHKSTPLLHFGNAYSASQYSLDTWHTAGAVWATDGSAFAYLDGVAGPEDTTNFQVNPAFLDFTYAGIGYSGSAFFGGFTGCMAAMAVWSAALSADNMLALYNGADPRTIQLSSLIAYLPMTDAATRTTDTQGNSWTSSVGSGSITDCASSPTINPIVPPLSGSGRRWLAEMGPIRSVNAIGMGSLGGYIDSYIDTYI